MSGATALITSLSEQTTQSIPIVTGARSRYRGRFAPSPTGPLHLGSLAAALASWLDARAHNGIWFVRMEDLDPPREQVDAARHIEQTLQAFELISDESVIYQSNRYDVYEQSLDRLKKMGRVFACQCSRKDVLQANGGSQRYPGTCRTQPHTQNRPIAWRLCVDETPITVTDRSFGDITQSLSVEIGEFVLKRADGLWAYQMAVVVDDAWQGVTHVVRGADLLDNTPRQVWLQRCLGLPTPTYMHIPVLTNNAGQKLSKQTGAPALNHSQPLKALERVWQHLGFAPIGADSMAAFYRCAIPLWHHRWAMSE